MGGGKFSRLRTKFSSCKNTVSYVQETYGHVTTKAKSDKVDRVTKEETYRPRDGAKPKTTG